jgi:hypothetical protein
MEDVARWPLNHTPPTQKGPRRLFHWIVIPFIRPLRFWKNVRPGTMCQSSWANTWKTQSPFSCYFLCYVRSLNWKAPSTPEFHFRLLFFLKSMFWTTRNSFEAEFMVIPHLNHYCWRQYKCPLKFSISGFLIPHHTSLLPMTHMQSQRLPQLSSKSSSYLSFTKKSVLSSVLG